MCHCCTVKSKIANAHIFAAFVYKNAHHLMVTEWLCCTFVIYIFCQMTPNQRQRRARSLESGNCFYWQAFESLN